MRFAAVVLVLIGSLMASSTVYADANDLIRISRCLHDNVGAKVATDVVIKYCVCMNNKMNKTETQSVTQWEKTNKVERAGCDRESGWE
ncbi:MAG: hypothetical protein NT178_04950 [Proteobacteria bacterium]|nr:hypothetical protein [Pseudomonadota bacterium]